MISSATLRSCTLSTPAHCCPRCVRAEKICKVWQKHSQTTALTFANCTGGKKHSQIILGLNSYLLGIAKILRMRERQSPRWGRTPRC